LLGKCKVRELDPKVKILYYSCSSLREGYMDAQVIWDDEPGANVEHIASHGLTPEEVDDVLYNDALPTVYSDSSGDPGKFGHTRTGRYIFVVWKEYDEDPRVIYPITAYDVPDPR
jgi:hypothetical protein